MKVYLREFENAPKGAKVETGRQGGRFFNAESRDQYKAWFEARPGVVKAHAGQPAAEAAPAVAPAAAVTDEVAKKREEKNAKERARRAAKKAQAAG